MQPLITGSPASGPSPTLTKSCSHDFHAHKVKEAHLYSGSPSSCPPAVSSVLVHSATYTAGGPCQLRFIEVYCPWVVN